MSMPSPSTPPDPVDKIVSALSNMTGALAPKGKAQSEKSQPWIAISISTVSLILSLCVAATNGIIVRHKLRVVIADSANIGYARKLDNKYPSDDSVIDAIFVNEGNASETVVAIYGTYERPGLRLNSVSSAPFVVKPGESIVAELPVATKLGNEPESGVKRINGIHMIYIDQSKQVIEKEIPIANISYVGSQDRREKLVTDPVELYNSTSIQIGH